jgi:Fur family ferric uptake transcriptional regulator
MNNALQVFRDYVKEKGLKDTAQREEILSFLLKAREHLSPEDIYESLRRRDPRLGRATVFRTLKLLEECGLASKVVFADGRSKYEPAHGRPHHDHMICVDCQQALEFESPEIEVLQAKEAARRGFQVLWHRHELFGRCRRCAGRAAGSPRAAAPRVRSRAG